MNYILLLIKVYLVLVAPISPAFAGERDCNADLDGNGVLLQDLSDAKGGIELGEAINQPSAGHKNWNYERQQWDNEGLKRVQRISSNFKLEIAFALECPMGSRLNQEVARLLFNAIEEIPLLPQVEELGVALKLLSLEDPLLRKHLSRLIKFNAHAAQGRMFFDEQFTAPADSHADTKKGRPVTTESTLLFNPKWARDIAALLRDGVGLESGTADFLFGRFEANRLRDSLTNHNPAAIPTENGVVDPSVTLLEQGIQQTGGLGSWNWVGRTSAPIDQGRLYVDFKDVEDIVRWVRGVAVGHPQNYFLLDAELQFDPKSPKANSRMRQFLLHQIKQLQKFKNSPLLTEAEQADWKKRYSVELALLRALRAMDGNQTSVWLGKGELNAIEKEEAEEIKKKEVKAKVKLKETEQKAHQKKGPEAPPEEPGEEEYLIDEILEARKKKLKRNPPVSLRESHQFEYLEMEEARRGFKGHDAEGEVQKIGEIIHKAELEGIIPSGGFSGLQRIKFYSLHPKWRALLLKRLQTASTDEKKYFLEILEEGRVQKMVDFLTKNGTELEVVLEVLREEIKDAGIVPPSAIRDPKRLEFQEKEKLHRWIRENITKYSNTPPPTKSLLLALSKLNILFNEGQLSAEAEKPEDHGRTHTHLRPKKAKRRVRSVPTEIENALEIRYLPMLTVAEEDAYKKLMSKASEKRRGQLEELALYFHKMGSSLPYNMRVQFLRLRSTEADVLMNLRDYMFENRMEEDFRFLMKGAFGPLDEAIAKKVWETKPQSYFSLVGADFIKPMDGVESDQQLNRLARSKNEIKAMFRKKAPEKDLREKLRAHMKLEGNKPDERAITKWLADEQADMENEEEEKQVSEEISSLFLENMPKALDWDPYAYDGNTLKPLTQLERDGKKKEFEEIETTRIRLEKEMEELTYRQFMKRVEFNYSNRKLANELKAIYPVEKNTKEDPKREKEHENRVKLSKELEKIVVRERAFDESQKKEAQDLVEAQRKVKERVEKARESHAKAVEANLKLHAAKLAKEYVSRVQGDKDKEAYLAQRFYEHFFKLKEVKALVADFENGDGLNPKKGAFESEITKLIKEKLSDHQNGLRLSEKSVERTIQQFRLEALKEKMELDREIAPLLDALAPVGIQVRNRRLDLSNAKLWMLSEHKDGRLTEKSANYIELLRKLGKLTILKQDGYQQLIDLTKARLVQINHHSELMKVNESTQIIFPGNSSTFVQYDEFDKECPLIFKDATEETAKLQRVVDRSHALIKEIAKANKERVKAKTTLNNIYNRGNILLQQKNGENVYDTELNTLYDELSRNAGKLLQGGHAEIHDPITDLYFTADAYGRQLLYQAKGLGKTEDEILKNRHQALDTVRDLRVNGAIIAGEMALNYLVTKGAATPLMANTKAGMALSRISRLLSAGKGASVSASAIKFAQFLHKASKGSIRGALTMVASNEIGQHLFINPYLAYKFYHTKEYKVGSDGKLRAEFVKKGETLPGFMDKDQDGKIDDDYEWEVNDVFSIAQKFNHGYRTFAIAHALPAQGLPYVNNFFHILGGSLINDAISSASSNVTSGDAESKLKEFIKPKNLGKTTLHALPTAVWGLPLHNVGSYAAKWGPSKYIGKVVPPKWAGAANRMAGYSVNAGVNAGSTYIEFKYMNGQKAVIQGNFVSEDVKEAIFLKLFGTLLMDARGSAHFFQVAPIAATRDYLNGTKPLTTDRRGLAAAVTGTRALRLSRAKEFNPDNSHANDLVKLMLPHTGIQPNTKNLAEYWNFVKQMRQSKLNKNASLFDSLVYFHEVKRDAVRRAFKHIREGEVEDFLREHFNPTEDANPYEGEKKIGENFVENAKAVLSQIPGVKIEASKKKEIGDTVLHNQLKVNNTFLDMPLSDIRNNVKIYAPLVQRVARLRSVDILPEHVREFETEFKAFKFQNPNLSLRQYINQFKAKRPSSYSRLGD